MHRLMNDGMDGGSSGKTALVARIIHVFISPFSSIHLFSRFLSSTHSGLLGTPRREAGALSTSLSTLRLRGLSVRMEAGWMRVAETPSLFGWWIRLSSR